MSPTNPPFFPASCHRGKSAFDVMMAAARVAAEGNKSRILMKPSSSNVEENYDDLSMMKKKKQKKGVVDSFEDGLVELKDKISLLKMEPTSFDSECIRGLLCSCLRINNNGGLPFIFPCLAFELISEETRRNVILDIACNMLRTIMAAGGKDNLVAVLCLSTGVIAPKYEDNSVTELGVGEAAVIKVIGETYGMSEVEVKKQYHQLGDLGFVAKSARHSQSIMFKSEPLTVTKVLDTFHLIAKEFGKHSKEKKRSLIKALLVASRGCESKYIIRMLMLKKTHSLRIGLLESTILDALGRAAVYQENLTPPQHSKSPLDEASRIVKEVFSILPDYDRIVTTILRSGIWNLQKECSFTIGIPVKPMLVQAIKSVSDIAYIFNGLKYICEYKYDGERAQIHYKENGIVSIYSRNLECSTEKYPDVAMAISRLRKPSIKSFVLDSEIVAYDREQCKILPLQVLLSRGRKHVDVDNIKIKACIFAFDLLYLNGKPLLHEELAVRKRHLHESFNEEPGFLHFPTALMSSDLDAIQQFLLAAIKESYEGLVIKKLNTDAAYLPDKREWLKLKKDYMEGLWDSLDLVPIAAFTGCGKRTGLYGSFLLACYDTNKDEFQSICKTASGFSEKMLEELSASLGCKVIPKPKSYYRFNADKFKPDVWFEPSEVWVVKAGGLTISSDHCAAIGLVDSRKGISLRHPRLICVRDDKDPEQATSSNQVSEMYFKQDKERGNH